jgi:hypothetical protein
VSTSTHATESRLSPLGDPFGHGRDQSRPGSQGPPGIDRLLGLVDDWVGSRRTPRSAPME